MYDALVVGPREPRGEGSTLRLLAAACNIAHCRPGFVICSLVAVLGDRSHPPSRLPRRGRPRGSETPLMHDQAVSCKAVSSAVHPWTVCPYLLEVGGSCLPCAVDLEGGIARSPCVLILEATFSIFFFQFFRGKLKRGK